MKNTKRAAETQQPLSETDHCSHHFGYMSQRSKGEEIPNECMTCTKLVKCILLTTENLEVSEQAEKPHIPPLKDDLALRETEREVCIGRKTKESSQSSLEENVKKEVRKKQDPEVKPKLISNELERNQLEVEDLGMLYASWSGTVRIDELTLLGWGGKIKEVEIETVTGKKMRCKVEPIVDSEKRIVQVPDKVQIYLGIQNGELVTVRPITKK